MIKNKYIKRTLSIAWPSVLESFFISVAGLIDTLMVSNLGSNAVAAVGLTTQPKLIAFSVFMAISVAVSALVARRKGEQDKKKANQTLVTAMLIAIILCILISTLTVFFTPDIIRLAGSNKATHKLGVDYLSIIMAGMIFNVIATIINAAQRGSGNTRIAFTTNLVSSVVNIFFNYLLINGNWGFPALGVSGAAIATVIGTAVAAIMSINSLFKRESFVSISLIIKKKIGFAKEIGKDILNFSSTIFAENIAARTGFLVTAITAAKLGTDQFAAHNVGMNLLSLTFAFGDGMQVAAVALTGNALGAKKKDEAIKYGKTCQEIGLAISAIIAVFLIIFRKYLFRIFFDDPKIIHIGEIIIMFMIFIVLFQISQVIFGGCLRAAGDVKFTLLSSLLSITLVRSISTLIYVNVLGLGIDGIWLGILSDQTCRFLILRWRFKQGKWVDRVI
ncbi:MAG: MATE family efflux transporter [Peptoniphilaceae bacterium]|nr:MATE family efflux transporter [Peptoniphilaceae bacterium]MDY6018203.1 MATE family efflux transporter [Anaerococcus sp.]